MISSYRSVRQNSKQTTGDSSRALLYNVLLCSRSTDGSSGAVGLGNMPVNGYWPSGKDEILRLS